MSRSHLQGPRVSLTQQTLKARARARGRPMVVGAHSTLALFFELQEQRVRRVTAGHLEHFQTRHKRLLEKSIANASDWKGDLVVTVRGQVGSDAHGEAKS